MLQNILLYGTSVIIWGSTWIAIKYQLGKIPPELSVAYRFFLAAFILFVWTAVARKFKKRNAKEHGWLAVQGLSLFSINYLFTYLSEQQIASGITAVTFSLVVLFNVLNGYLWLGNPIRKKAIWGGLFGLAGMSLVFFDELTKVQFSHSTFLGLSFGLAACFVASLGNIAAVRNHRHGLSVLEGNAFGMLYGALFMFGVALARGQRFEFDTDPPYVYSLLYLAVFGSVIAFSCYLTLVKRIGADIASYVAVLIPIVALVISTYFEAYRWTGLAFFGIGLILTGNVIVLWRAHR